MCFMGRGTKSLKSFRTSQLRLAPFKQLSSHMWRVVAIFNSRSRGFSLPCLAPRLGGPEGYAPLGLSTRTPACGRHFLTAWQPPAHQRSAPTVSVSVNDLAAPWLFTT